MGVSKNNNNHQSVKKVHITILLVAIMMIVVSRVALAAPYVDQLQAKHSPNNYNDLVEDIISDLLTDGDRWKKSKINTSRSVKQTLRFGRRSDPLWSATFSEEQPGDRFTLAKALYNSNK